MDEYKAPLTLSDVTVLESITEMSLFADSHTHSHGSGAGVSYDQDSDKSN